MPPPLLIDLARVDLQRVLLSRDQIYERFLPHRFEFMTLDGVCHVDADGGSIVTYADIRSSDWWVRGHVPGRSLLPGVLMLEMAGQTAGITAKMLADCPGFIALGGVEECKFRDAVIPPCRLYILATGVEMRPRRIIAKTQGVVEGRLVFEATIIGMTLR